MRVLIRVIALIAAPVLIFGLSLGFAPESLASNAESIVTTLYAYPTLPSWQQVESAAPTVSASIVDICAPDGSGSGCNGQPADAENTVWPPTIQALQQAGITPLYYIWTDYGATPLATVESELQNAITWYGVSSPMFDGTSTSASEASYYQTLYNFAIANGAKIVMFNPGTVAPQSYMFGPDEILQQFEGTEAQFDAATFPSWMSSYPASEFSAVISAGTSAGVGTDVSDAAQDGIGNIYVDDEAEPPNYSTLPAFWSAEVQDVAGTTAPAAQTITFPSPGPGVVGQSGTLTATGGGSGNPVVFSVDASSGAGVCSVSGTNGATVNYLAAGTCVIDANQAGGSGYAAAPQVQQTITVSASGTQTITFPSPGPGVVGQSATLTATGGGSGNPVVFSVDASSGAGVCSVSGTNGSTVNYLAAGSCVIDANQAGGNGYTAAAQVQQTITVSTADTQTITFPSPGPGVVGQSATLTATGGGSGNPVVFSVDASSGAGVCSVSGTNGATVNYLAAGTCIIDANQAAGNGYAAAPEVQQSITVSAAPATQLAFTTQPGGGAGGAAWSVQPAVSVENASGNVVAGNSSAVTLAIASQPGSGASLSCTANPVTAVNGVASFAGCKITGKAGSYTLKAADGSLTSATSASFSVTAGAAAQLAFTTQPGGGTNAVAWSAQPKVSVEDASGNVVATNTSAVTLAIASQPGSGATLSCTTNPVTASAGVAAFAGCKITGKAGSYTLKATDGSLTSATSASFSVTAGAAAQLVFTTQPGGGANGAAWSTQPKVSVEDASGNAVTTNTSAVTLAIASQPGSGATLSCTTNPVTASAGVASFAGCKITGKAGSYTLKATDGSLTSATSASFSVTVGAATQLIFTTQPGGGYSGLAWSTQPKVSVEDASGNVVTTNASAVTLGIASQPGSGAALSCTANPVAASAGVASFAGCKITGKAGSYTLKATDGSLTSATSKSFSLMNLAAKAAGLVGMSDAAPEVPSP
jgi:trimeric autotransporter adhesin